MARNTLTPKQAAFVREYLVDLHQMNAAIRAGYAVSSADVVSTRLMKFPKIAAAIAEAMEKRAKRTTITADMVVAELAKVALSDLSRAFDKGGNLLPLHDMPPEARAAISGMDVEELFEGKGDERQLNGLLKKIRQWDKVKALELLAKHFGLLKDKVEVTGEGGKALSITIDLGAGK